jgi:hypothetical protein
MSKALEQFAKRALVAVRAVASYWAQGVQNEARTQARWQDRTSNARSGIFYAVDGFDMPPLVGEVSVPRNLKSDVAVEAGDANTLIVSVAHTVFYGKYLEVSNGGRNAIIMSTIEKNLPKLEQLVQEIFAG